jgi:cytochrome c oxidase subunit 4
MSHDNTQAHGGGEHGHHVVPMKVYFGVFGTLLFLTVVTVAVAQVDLGPANMLVAMLVATIKASLVCAFFMQLKYDEKLNTIIFVFGLIFVALFFLFTLLDVFSRGFLDPRQDNLYMQKEAMQKLHYDLEQKRTNRCPVSASPPIRRRRTSSCRPRRPPRRRTVVCSRTAVFRPRAARRPPTWPRPAVKPPALRRPPPRPPRPRPPPPRLPRPEPVAGASSPPTDVPPGLDRRRNPAR